MELRPLSGSNRWKRHIKTYERVHNDRPDRYYELGYTKDTHFRPIQLIEDYNPQNIHHENGKDTYLDDELHDQENLQFRLGDNPPTDDEDILEIKDNKLFRTLIELWQTNSEANSLEEKEE